MKAISHSLLFVLACLTSAGANAAGSALRVTCEGDDVGAEVLINGIFKGECPLDMQVPAGKIKLTVQKKIDNEDRLFEQEIRMGDGVSKKVEAKLLSKVVLLRLKKAEAGDVGEMQVIAYFYQIGIKGWPKNIEQYLLWTRKVAETGNGSAMMALGQAYEEGNGVAMDTGEANRWYSQGLPIIRSKADGGDTNSMIDLGSAYLAGHGVTRDRAMGLMWFHKAKDAGYEGADQLLEIYGEK